MRPTLLIMFCTQFIRFSGSEVTWFDIQSAIRWNFSRCLSVINISWAESFQNIAISSYPNVFRSRDCVEVCHLFILSSFLSDGMQYSCLFLIVMCY